MSETTVWNGIRRKNPSQTDVFLFEKANNPSQIHLTFTWTRHVHRTYSCMRTDQCIIHTHTLSVIRFHTLKCINNIATSLKFISGNSYCTMHQLHKVQWEQILWISRKNGHKIGIWKLKKVKFRRLWTKKWDRNWELKRN